MKFKVNWTLNMGDKQHKAGDVVEMKDKAAEGAEGGTGPTQ
jgi:hypothetical protein